MVLRIRTLRPMPLGAVSSPVWSLADWIWSRGWLRCLRAILLEMPFLSTVIASLSLFTWVPLGIFLRLFKNGFHSHYEGFCLILCLSLPFFGFHSHYKGFCLFLCLSLPLFLFLILITIIDWASCNRLSKNWYGPYVHFDNLQQISRANWLRNLSFKITFPSSLSGSISVNLSRAFLSLSRNLPGASFYSCSMSASLP